MRQQQRRMQQLKSCSLRHHQYSYSQALVATSEMAAYQSNPSRMRKRKSHQRPKRMKRTNHPSFAHDSLWMNYGAIVEMPQDRSMVVNPLAILLPYRLMNRRLAQDPVMATEVTHRRVTSEEEDQVSHQKGREDSRGTRNWNSLLLHLN